MSEDELIKKLEELVKIAHEFKLERIELEEITWIDDATGKEPSIKVVFGKKIENPTVLDKVEEIAKIVYTDGAFRVNARFIAITNEGVFIQFAEDIYNQYGRWVATARWWDSLENLIKRFRAKTEEINKAYKNAVKRLADMASRL